MPTYRNDTASAITPLNGKTVDPGETYHSLEYLKNEQGLTLVKHAQSGFAGVTLYDGGPSSGSVEVHIYDRVFVYNGTDAEISITPNEDTENARRLPPNSVLKIENTSRRAWHSLAVDGSGAGYIQVIGE